MGRTSGWICWYHLTSATLPIEAGCSAAFLLSSKSDVTGCLRCRTDCQHPLAWCALELRLTIQTPRCPPFAAAGMGVVYKSSLMDVFGLQNVVNQFMQVASDHRCSFLGNVTVGRDVPLATLQQMYHAVRCSCHFHYLPLSMCDLASWQHFHLHYPMAWRMLECHRQTA